MEPAPVTVEVTNWTAGTVTLVDRVVVLLDDGMVRPADSPVL